MNYIIQGIISESAYSYTGKPYKKTMGMIKTIFTYLDCDNSNTLSSSEMMDGVNNFILVNATTTSLVIKLIGMVKVSNIK